VARCGSLFLGFVYIYIYIYIYFPPSPACLIYLIFQTYVAGFLSLSLALSLLLTFSLLLFHSFCLSVSVYHYLSLPLSVCLSLSIFLTVCRSLIYKLYLTMCAPVSLRLFRFSTADIINTVRKSMYDLPFDRLSSFRFITCRIYPNLFFISSIYLENSRYMFHDTWIMR